MSTQHGFEDIPCLLDNQAERVPTTELYRANSTIVHYHAKSTPETDENFKKLVQRVNVVLGAPDLQWDQTMGKWVLDLVYNRMRMPTVDSPAILEAALGLGGLPQLANCETYATLQLHEEEQRAKA